MKNKLSLHIPKPCTEKWRDFSLTPNGGFCSSCSKVVIDFTKMGDEEISDFFARKPEHACGRFRPDQLKTYTYQIPATIMPGFQLMKAGVVSLFLLALSEPVVAQTNGKKDNSEVVHRKDKQHGKKSKDNSEHTVGGVVKGEGEEGGLPGVVISLKGSTEGTVSDRNGRFEFPVKLKAGDVLLFNFIGYETQECVVPRESLEIINIVLSMEYTLMGEVAINDVYTAPESGLKGWLLKVRQLF